MSEFKKTKLSEILVPYENIFSPDEANQLNLKRIKKIDFQGNIHLAEDVQTKTKMVLIKTGMLVISGINVSKGAITVYEGEEDVMATIHYSAYSYDKDRINPIYLRYLFQSTLFLNSVKSLTRGGIKTEIKSKDLLSLEVKFHSEQKRQDAVVANIRKSLSNLDKLKLKIKKLDSAFQRMLEAHNQYLINSIIKQSDLMNLTELLEGKGMQNGISPQEVEDGTHNALTSFSLAATSAGFFNFAKIKIVDGKEVEFNKYKLSKGDLLIQRGNSSHFVGVSAVFDGKDEAYIYPDLMIRLKVNNLILSKYLHIFLMSQGIRDYFRSVASGTNDTMKKINQAKIKKIEVPVPEKNIQKKLIAESENFKKNHEKIMHKLSSLNFLLKDATSAFIDHCFSK